MNQFQVFMIEKLTQTDNRKEVLNRNDIYECYSRWFYYDNVIVKTIFLANGELHKGKPYIPSVLKYNKIIGRVEF